MAFGQQSGTPASARQLKSLLTLLEHAGYTGFRDARGPLGFTQRQGGGKFTGPEAEAFIEQLEGEAEAARLEAEGAPPGGPDASPEAALPPGLTRAADVAAPAAATSATARREARQAASIREMPAKILARELERRGWILIPPEDLTPADPSPTDPTPPSS